MAKICGYRDFGLIDTGSTYARDTVAFDSTKELKSHRITGIVSPTTFRLPAKQREAIFSSEGILELQVVEQAHSLIDRGPHSDNAVFWNLIETTGIIKL